MNVYFFKFASFLYLLGTLGLFSLYHLSKRASLQNSIGSRLPRFRLPYFSPHHEVC